MEQKRQSTFSTFILTFIATILAVAITLSVLWFFSSDVRNWTMENLGLAWQTDLDTANDTIAEKEAEIALLQAELDAKNAALLQKQSDLELSEQHLAELQSQIVVLQTRISELEANIETLQLNALANTARIAELQNEKSALEAQVELLQSDKTTLQQTITGLHSQISELQSQIQDVTERLNALSEPYMVHINSTGLNLIDHYIFKQTYFDTSSNAFTAVSTSTAQIDDDYFSGGNEITLVMKTLPQNVQVTYQCYHMENSEILHSTGTLNFSAGQSGQQIVINRENFGLWTETTPGIYTCQFSKIILTFSNV